MNPLMFQSSEQPLYTYISSVLGSGGNIEVSVFYSNRICLFRHVPTIIIWQLKSDRRSAQSKIPDRVGILDRDAID